MEIYFLRHANAGDPKLDPTSDEERPIDKLGIEQSHNVGRALAALDIKLDAVIASPLTRAMQTAEIAAEELGYKGKIVTRRRVATGSQLRAVPGAASPPRTQRRNHGRRPQSQHDGVREPDAFPDSVAGRRRDEERRGGEGGERRQQPAVLKWSMTPKVIRAIQQASASSSRPKTVSK